MSDDLHNWFKGIRLAIRTGATKGVTSAQKLAEQRIKKRISRRAGGGKIQTRYGPRRVVKASAPGEPPIRDLGVLYRSIKGKRRKIKGGHTAEVFAGAPYARALELGNPDNDLAPRPFMGPTVAEDGDEIVETMSEGVLAELRTVK